MEDQGDELQQRQSPDPATSRASRCLFGVGNSELNKSFSQKILLQERQRMKAKYNFDFDSETPLQGTFEWEIVHSIPGRSIPSFYQPQTLSRGRRTLSDRSIFSNWCSVNDTMCNEQRSYPSSQVTHLQHSSAAPASQTDTRCSQQNASPAASAGFDENNMRGTRKRFITGELSRPSLFAPKQVKQLW